MRHAIRCAVMLTILCSINAVDDDKVQRLIWRIIDQTGTTDGYPSHIKYNIDTLEPAKTLIAEGAVILPLLKLNLRDKRQTKATWPGRTGTVVLTVSDVSVLLIGHVGGKDELAFLADREKYLKQTIEDMVKYKDSQTEWSNEWRDEFIERFDRISFERTMALWAMETIKARASK